MYPENPGTGTLVFASPGFPHAVITLASGKTITINAPGASAKRFYVKSLRINGKAHGKLYVPYATLAKGATLAWSLGTAATSWGTAAADAPPSYGPTYPGSASVSPETLYLQPGASATVKLSARLLASTAQAVTWQTSPASGVTLAPASGSLTVPAGAQGTVNVKVTAGTSDGDYPVSISLASPAGKLIPVELAVVVAKPGDLAPYYDIAGISNDKKPTVANYDGDGFSYSQQALTKAGLAPGATVTSHGLSYTWPDVAAAQPDAINAAGQTIPVTVPAGASSLGFLGSAVNSGTAGASGTVTITYTDGSASTATLGMSDWTLSAGQGSPQFHNVIVARLPYRNMMNGQPDKVKTYVFADTVPVDSSKTVASITLPTTVNNGSIGIFAISAG